MYHLQVLFCSMIQNDAGFVFEVKPTVEHVISSVSCFIGSEW